MQSPRLESAKVLATIAHGGGYTPRPGAYSDTASWDHQCSGCGAAKAFSLSAAAAQLSSAPPACARPPHPGSTGCSGSPSSGTGTGSPPLVSTDGRRHHRRRLSSSPKPWWSSYVLPSGQKSLIAGNRSIYFDLRSDYT